MAVQSNQIIAIRVPLLTEPKYMPLCTTVNLAALPGAPKNIGLLALTALSYSDGTRFIYAKDGGGAVHQIIAREAASG